MSERPHGADRCHTPQCREGGGRRDELRPAGTDDGQRGCLEGAGVAPRCPGSGVPSLALAVLGGGGDGVDASCLAFLVRRAVEDKKEEEERKKEAKRQQARFGSRSALRSS